LVKILVTRDELLAETPKELLSDEEVKQGEGRPLKYCHSKGYIVYVSGDK